jgi:hypothetical protein
MKFITIKSSRNATDLLVLKSKLESEGIRCRIKNNLSSQVLNYLPMMAAELQIAEEDVHMLKDLLAENGVVISNEKKLICPQCGSTHVRVKYTPKTLLKAFVMLVTSVVSMNAPADIFKHSKLKCMHCYHVFSQNDSE